MKSMWLAFCVLAGCGGPTDVAPDADAPDAVEAPRCHDSVPQPPPPGQRLPSSCDSFLLYPGACTSSGSGVLTVDGVRYPLERACAGPMDIADNADHVFDGMYLTFAPADSCDPVVGVAVGDVAQLAAPGEVSLATPLCSMPASARENVVVLVELGGACGLRPVGAAGTLSLDTLGLASARGVLTTPIAFGDTPAVDMTLTFDIATPAQVGGIIVDPEEDLCAP